MRKYLARKLHVSWLVAWFSAAILYGLASAHWVSMSTEKHWIFAATAIIIFAISKIDDRYGVNY